MKQKLGMRIIKTGIGIYLSLLICNLLGFEKGALAAITTVVALQPSLMQSLKTIKNQILATIIGITIAVIITYYFHGYGLSIAVAAIITIWICIRLGWQDSITLAVITLILVADNTTGDFLTVAIHRTLMILIGLAVAFTLNFILPPSHIYRLKCKVDELRKAFEDFYVKSVDDLMKAEPMTEEEEEKNITVIKKLLDESWSIYDLSVESKLSYNQNKEKDVNFLLKKSISAIESNLERLLEIRYSINSLTKGEDQLEIREKIHYYLQGIFICHKQSFDYIFSGQEIDNPLENQFLGEKKQIENMILTEIKDRPTLYPFNYYTMVMEGERIINEVRNLMKIKDQEKVKIKGEYNKAEKKL